MNNRVQIFDINGKFVSKIHLNFDWIKQGVTYYFAILNGQYFALIGKPPHYSFMDADIYVISPNGTLLKHFGSKQLNKNKEEYFSSIVASDQTKKIYCSIGGSTKIATYDLEGNFMKYMTDVKSAPEIMLNSDGQVIKTAPSYCSAMDSKGNCYKIWSKSSSKTGFVITTQIQIFPPNSTSNDIITHHFGSDVKFVSNGAEHSVRYKGNYGERSVVSLDGTIYHMIALDDGIVLRRLTWNSQ